MEEDASLFPEGELLDGVPLVEGGNKGLLMNSTRFSSEDDKQRASQTPLTPFFRETTSLKHVFSLKEGAYDILSLTERIINYGTEF